MAKFCKDCAKEGEKVYLKRIRRTLSLVMYKCPKCDKVEIVNRKR